MRMTILSLAVSASTLWLSSCKTRNPDAKTLSIGAKSSSCDSLKPSSDIARISFESPGGLSTYEFLFDVHKKESLKAGGSSEADSIWYARVCAPERVVTSGVRMHVDNLSKNQDAFHQSLSKKDESLDQAVGLFNMLQDLYIAMRHQSKDLQASRDNREIGAKIDDWILWFGRSAISFTGQDFGDTGNLFTSIGIVGAYGGSRVARLGVVGNFLKSLWLRQISVSSLFSLSALRQGGTYALGRSLMGSAYGVLTLESAYLIKSLADLGAISANAAQEEKFATMLNAELRLRTLYAQLANSPSAEFRRNLYLANMEWLLINGVSPSSLTPGTTSWALFAGLQKSIEEDEMKRGLKLDYSASKAASLN